MATISAALATALSHHQAGRLELAEEIYRRIVAVEPEHAQAMHLLGLIAHQRGQYRAAIELVGRAIAVAPREAHFHSNLGETYRALGQFVEAIDCYRRALELDPHLAQAHNNLGEAYRAQGNTDEAMACYRRALELAPQSPAAHNNLGIALQNRGRLSDAVACYRRAIEAKPEYAKAYNNLGSALIDERNYAEAVACYQRAVQLDPLFAEAHYGLGAALQGGGSYLEAAACYRRALELEPDMAEAECNLGSIALRQGRPDEALTLCLRAIEHKPEMAETYTNLGNVRKDQGLLTEALAAYRKAVELKPQSASAHSNLVYTLHFSPAYDARAIYDEHRRFAEQHAAPLAASIRPHANDRSPERRLRIGYVSPDFRAHVVGMNLLPLLRAHDHRQFEIVCYSDVMLPDAITERLRPCADVWRETAALGDEQLAEQIRADRVDILVDLTLHMDGNRLLTLARKPAPVQVTFAGYPGTTGLAAIDYRLTDPHLDPPGLDDRHYAEQSIRLPDTFWCYDPQPNDPEVSSLPALAQGFVTFGCLNNFCKVNGPVLKLWADVLRQVDRAQLVMLAAEGSHRQRARDVLAAEGVSPERVSFVVSRPRSEYLQTYHRIDIGLDTFPYNGHSTSLDSFWMGVPVVTLSGPTAVGRAGVSQLKNLGLAELVADTPDGFARIAVQLAADLQRLAQLRATLRDRMRKSPLMDAPRFARSVEAAYRMMWQRWCEKALP